MSWRTVIVKEPAKLDLQAGFLVSRNVCRAVKKVVLNEIDILLLENSAVSITAPLLIELMRRDIRVIFCDEKRNPCGELQPYYGSHNSFQRIQEQLSWNSEVAQTVWAAIVSSKINMQARLLECTGKRNVVEYLHRFAAEVAPGDPTNREAQAAKIYFPALFGPDFVRNRPDNVNFALNYGYSMLMSAFNRYITIMGFLTQFGIFHKGATNPFNLGCDLMEPWRPFIDKVVFDMQDDLLTAFSSAEKRKLVNALHAKISIGDKEQVLLNGIDIYVRSVIDAIQTGDTSQIILPQLC